MFGLLERYARAILASGLAERVEKVEAQLKQMKTESAAGKSTGEIER